MRAAAAVALVLFGIAGVANAQSKFVGPVGPVVTELWEFESPNAAVLNNPVVDINGNLFVALSFGYVYCLDGANGKTRWTYRSSDGSGLGQPVVAEYGMTYVPTTLGVVALNTGTGQVVWYWKDGTKQLVSATVVLDPSVPNAVYVSGRTNGANGAIFALNIGNGNVIWSGTVPYASTDMLASAGQVVVGPAIGTLQSSITVTAFDGVLGTAEWTKVLSALPAIYTAFQFTIDGNGHLVLGFTAPGNEVFVYSLWITPPNKGSMRWSLSTMMASATPVGFVGPFMYYLGNTTLISAYELVSGDFQWQSSTALSALQPVPIISVPGDYVYVATGGLNAISLAALDTSTGDVIWSFQDPQAKGVFGNPVFDSAGTLYIETFSQAGSTVYALNPHTGAVLFQYNIDETATIYYDTAIAVGKGVIFVGNDMECEAIGVKSKSSGPSGGVIAAAVICTLLGVAAIGAAVWYFKFKRPGSFSSFSSPFSVGASSYQPFGTASSSVPASSGAYSYNASNI